MSASLRETQNFFKGAFSDLMALDNQILWNKSINWDYIFEKQALNIYQDLNHLNLPPTQPQAHAVGLQPPASRDHPTLYPHADRCFLAHSLE